MCSFGATLPPLKESDPRSTFLEGCVVIYSLACVAGTCMAFFVDLFWLPKITKWTVFVIHVPYLPHHAFGV